MKLYQFFDQDTPEYVALHAQYRESRGKRPSVNFRGINNPREALKEAYTELFHDDVHMLFRRKQAVTCPIIQQILQVLGFRPASQDELEEILRRVKSEKTIVWPPSMIWDRTLGKFCYKNI